MSAPTDWYRDWFGITYLSLYPHRDEAEARAAVELFESAVHPEPGSRVLDLACGAGRHVRQLREAGHRPIGIDLSEALLRAAREYVGPSVALIRGDMRRLPFREHGFDAITSFFTSFGYFETVEEDALVVSELRRVLRRNGKFLFDYLNEARVRATLVPTDERRVPGRVIRQTRWLEDDVVVKRIEIDSNDLSEPEVHFERVRLYSPRRLVELLARHGLQVQERFGDYDGGAFSPDSPRLILSGHAT
ncbi:MAG: class I SAM-dependent methyltransferase [Gemmatimonadota bacterium]